MYEGMFNTDLHRSRTALDICSQHLSICYMLTTDFWMIAKTRPKQFSHPFRDSHLMQLSANCTNDQVHLLHIDGHMSVLTYTCSQIHERCPRSHLCSFMLYYRGVGFNGILFIDIIHTFSDFDSWTWYKFFWETKSHSYVLQQLPHRIHAIMVKTI